MKRRHITRCQEARDGFPRNISTSLAALLHAGVKGLLNTELACDAEELKYLNFVACQSIKLELMPTECIKESSSFAIPESWLA